jgi:hypothetical protein
LTSPDRYPTTAQAATERQKVRTVAAILARELAPLCNYVSVHGSGAGEVKASRYGAHLARQLDAAGLIAEE